MGRKGAAAGEEHPFGSAVLVVFGVAVAVGALRYGWGSFDSPGAGFLPFFAGVGHRRLFGHYPYSRA